MIRAYNEADYASVVALWQEAFGDAKEDIDPCLNAFKDDLFVYQKEDCIVAMFMLLPLTRGSEDGYYIYAVATLKSARGQGIATKLLDYAKEKTEKGNKAFLALVPAKPALFDFYEKRGFTAGTLMRKKTYKKDELADTSLSIRPVTPHAYFILRENFFKNVSLTAWSAEMLEKIENIYGECFYEASDGSFCMAYAIGDKLIIPEICLNDATAEEVVSALAKPFNVTCAEAVLLDKNGEPFAMFYPSNFADSYFNIAIN